MKIRIIFLVLSLVVFEACNRSNKEKLVVATSANMHFAMEELIQSFSDSTGINCDLVVSSSGKLTAQILQGAPYDIFFSADMKYPEKIFNAGLAHSNPEIYAHGKLVLWTMAVEIEPAINILKDEGVKRIAIANPKTAPYGMAAKETLEYYGIYEEVEKKLVYGESIAQTNQFVTTKAVDFGFTAKSVVLSEKVSGMGTWIEIDPDIYTPIAQGMVILNNGNNQLESAQILFEFLQSEKGKEILNKFGYTVDN